MTGTVEINLGGKRLLLRFNNFSVDAMRKQLLGLIPKDDERTPEEVINDIVGQSDMLALQALIHSGLCGDAYPQFKLPAMTIQEVGQALADLTPEEMAAMWGQVNEAKAEANGPAPKKKAKASRSPKKKS